MGTDDRKTEEAVVAGGCFWGVQELIRKLPGVVETEVGYTGGALDNPTYKDITRGDTGHAEAVRIVFDPSVVSYESILDLFFRLHDPTTRNRQGNDTGSQYRSAIFYNSDAQREVAERVKDRVDTSGKWPRPVVTEIVPATEFYPAESVHQDYYRRNADQPYCRVVIDPKLARFRKNHPDRLVSAP